jgi:hypothetical protein
VLDEVIDAPENVGISADPGHGTEREDPFVEAFASKLEGNNMATEKNSSNQPDDQEEISAEVTATNEGMPAGEIDEEPKDAEEVQAPEAFDAEKQRKERSGESKGAAAGE